jgi:signal transduction histidine kinase
MIAGFALLILLLIGSTYVGVKAIRSTESNSARLLEEQRVMLRLIDNIQQEEDSLSAVFYELATGTAENRQDLLKRLEAVEEEIRRNTRTGLASGNIERWEDLTAQVEAFIAEGRRTLQSGQPPSAAFFRGHERLINTLGRHAAFAFDSAAKAQREELEASGERVRFSLILLALTLVVAFAGAIFTVRVASKMFRRLEWQAFDLAQLSSRTMANQEETARRFSRELHDEFGQALSAIEANLVAIGNLRHFDPTRLEDCLALTKQAIDNARELSQLLRPSILDDFGLVAGIRWLAENFSQRTGIRVNCTFLFEKRLNGEAETQLFRIVQEALTTVARHANATAVEVELKATGSAVILRVSDNGTGVSGEKRVGGLGLVGARARARSLGGILGVKSQPGQGLTIEVSLPLNNISNAAQDSYLTSR